MLRERAWKINANPFADHALPVFNPDVDDFFAEQNRADQKQERNAFVNFFARA